MGFARLNGGLFETDLGVMWFPSFLEPLFGVGVAAIDSGMYSSSGEFLLLVVLGASLVSLSVG